MMDMDNDNNTNKSNVAEKTIDVVLIRHAQSQWNLENRFTGWANPPLTAAGFAEARRAAQLLRAHGYEFDAAFSSRLLRAQQTLDVLLETLGQMNLPRFQDWRLNERHYGQLQGINKAEEAKQVGEQQVWRWRRGYEDKAAPLSRNDPAHPVNDPLYRDVDPALLPDVENLAETRARVMQFWQERIAPCIRLGERVVISGHGNTFRALIMGLANLSIKQVESFEIPTGKSIVYTFNRNAEPLHWRYLEEQQSETIVV
ncbi:MAG: 2,3-bisphosphoglycerate-dependent phosphoglycerate mutase [Gammaproteobacteria bacterium]|nr:2,3-bisphosphoglycerate-dependent phosphoglycerate mutase [Gammaproteobacteria bacterium]